jgi:AbrB family looped-hinge helix DNA binding protein
MTATVYNRGQMVIPAQARKQARIGQGDLLNVQIQGDGRLLLVRLERPKETPAAKVRIIRRKGKHPVGDIGRPITREEIKTALADFP